MIDDDIFEEYRKYARDKKHIALLIEAERFGRMEAEIARLREALQDIADEARKHEGIMEYYCNCRLPGIFEILKQLGIAPKGE